MLIIYASATADGTDLFQAQFVTFEAKQLWHCGTMIGAR